MKATLEFDLPEDQDDFNDSRKGPVYWDALFEFDQWLRSKLKHEEHSEDIANAYEAVRARFFEILRDHDIQI